MGAPGASHLGTWDTLELQQVEQPAVLRLLPKICQGTSRRPHDLYTSRGSNRAYGVE